MIHRWQYSKRPMMRLLSSSSTRKSQPTTAPIAAYTRLYPSNHTRKTSRLWYQRPSAFCQTQGAPNLTSSQSLEDRACAPASPPAWIQRKASRSLGRSPSWASTTCKHTRSRLGSSRLSLGALPFERPLSPSSLYLFLAATRC